MWLSFQSYRGSGRTSMKEGKGREGKERKEGRKEGNWVPWELHQREWWFRCLQYSSWSTAQTKLLCTYPYHRYGLQDHGNECGACRQSREDCPANSCCRRRWCRLRWGRWSPLPNPDMPWWELGSRGWRHCWLLQWNGSPPPTKHLRTCRSRWTTKHAPQLQTANDQSRDIYRLSEFYCWSWTWVVSKFSAPIQIPAKY